MNKIIRLKRLISSILVVSLLNLVGCYSFQHFSVPEYKQVEDEEGEPDEVYIITKYSKEYHFSNSDYYIEKDTLYGKTKMYVTDVEQPFDGKFALSEIKHIQFLAPNENYSIVTVSEYLRIEAEGGKPDEINLTTVDSKRYHFMKDDYSIKNDTFYGKGKLLSRTRAVPIDIKIALSDIESFQLERFSWLYTSILSLSIAGFIAWFIINAVCSSGGCGSMGGGFSFGGRIID